MNTLFVLTFPPLVDNDRSVNALPQAPQESASQCAKIESLSVAQGLICVLSSVGATDVLGCGHLPLQCQLPLSRVYALTDKAVGRSGPRRKQRPSLNLTNRE